ncbi:hypothetical protein ANACOL_00635 [Anaerotruncus colihominis DSM 17241]|uniref:Uncharacterized protein n=1 Tax=Anaerotruncus colihominis DSM 17241 TaxID=445972 RepID=B0P7A5_9FIRM|nr:hypothetical protein ANACOL_00635 [Anaerotruncus colihominis DSM 17241]
MFKNREFTEFFVNSGNLFGFRSILSQYSPPFMKKTEILIF